MRTRGPRPVVILAIVLMAWSGSGLAAQDRPGSPAPDSGAVTMRTLLERTIFRIDVVTLTVRIGGEAGDRIERIVERGSWTEAVADSVAAIATDARRAEADLVFHRDVSQERFLDAVRDGLATARDAGIVDSASYRDIERSLPGWYAFLEGRGVREGDEMTYTIRGDTLRTRFRSAEGPVLLDQTDVGAARRRAVLGGYFARGSEFREGLLRSLVGS